MKLSHLFEEVNGITLEKTLSIPIKKSSIKIVLSNKKPKANSKKTKNKSVDKPNTKKKKTKEEGIKDKIIQIIEELAEIENNEQVIEDHINGSIKDNYAEIFHMHQYQHQLSQYQRFLSAYLKDYKHAIEAGIKNPEYNDAFDKADVPVPKREFGYGQEVMTNSEIRDIVRRKRMNWLLGNEHNPVSPDEKERYKFWKMFSKFNYVMAEGCMFNL
jgi:hypothetical protein